MDKEVNISGAICITLVGIIFLLSGLVGAFTKGLSFVSIAGIGLILTSIGHVIQNQFIIDQRLIKLTEEEQKKEQ